MTLVKFIKAKDETGAGNKIYVNADAVVFIEAISKKSTMLCLQAEALPKSWVRVEGNIDEVVEKLRGKKK